MGNEDDFKRQTKDEGLIIVGLIVFGVLALVGLVGFVDYVFKTVV